MIKTISTASLALLIVAGAAPAMAQSSWYSTAGDWSGPYVGVYGGALESDDNANEQLVFDRDFDGQFDDTVVLNGTSNNAFSPGSCDGTPSSASNGNCDRDPGGVEGGIRAGWDMQFGSWVVGAVAELSAVKAEDSVTSFSTTPANYAFTRQLEHTASLRARVGYASGPALVYITGGPAYGKIENRFTTTNGANSFTERSNEDDADGYQAGAGVEWRLAPSLTLVGEYLYTDLDAGDYVVRVGNTGTTPATNPFILPPNTAGTDMTRNGDQFRMHAFRLGMNVQF